MKKKLFFTEHGNERLVERLKCAESKIEKIVRKAATSKGDNIPPVFDYMLKKHREENHFYKYYLGYIFVFAKVEGGDLFITLYNPKEKLQKNKK